MLKFTDFVDYGILYYLIKFFEKNELHLLKVNKKLLIVRDYYYWEFNQKYSIQYYSDFEFKNRVLSVIKNPNKKLSLNLRRCNVTDVSALGGVDRLDLSYCKFITDVRALCNVPHLNLSCCKSITDFTALGNHIILNLSGTNIKDISKLSNIFMLKLSGCKKITNFSTLSNIDALILIDCSAIIYLNNVKNIILTDGKYDDYLLDR
jgi:hypothetical protein